MIYMTHCRPKYIWCGYSKVISETQRSCSLLDGLQGEKGNNEPWNLGREVVYELGILDRILVRTMPHNNINI